MFFCSVQPVDVKLPTNSKVKAGSHFTTPYRVIQSASKQGKLTERDPSSNKKTMGAKQNNKVNFDLKSLATSTLTSVNGKTFASSRIRTLKSYRYSTLDSFQLGISLHVVWIRSPESEEHNELNMPLMIMLCENYHVFLIYSIYAKIFK